MMIYGTQRLGQVDEMVVGCQGLLGAEVHQ
jgi:hypothetical protein